MHAPIPGLLLPTGSKHCGSGESLFWWIPKVHAVRCSRGCSNLPTWCALCNGRQHAVLAAATICLRTSFLTKEKMADRAQCLLHLMIPAAVLASYVSSGTAPNKFGQDPSGAFIGQLAAAVYQLCPPPPPLPFAAQFLSSGCMWHYEIWE